MDMDNAELEPATEEAQELNPVTDNVERQG